MQCNFKYLWLASWHLGILEILPIWEQQRTIKPKENNLKSQLVFCVLFSQLHTWLLKSRAEILEYNNAFYMWKHFRTFSTYVYFSSLIRLPSRKSFTDISISKEQTVVTQNYHYTIHYDLESQIKQRSSSFYKEGWTETQGLTSTLTAPCISGLAINMQLLLLPFVHTYNYFNFLHSLNSLQQLTIIISHRFFPTSLPSRKFYFYFSLVSHYSNSTVINMSFNSMASHSKRGRHGEVHPKQTSAYLSKKRTQWITYKGWPGPQ